jgi:hypothetical protein
MLHASRMLLATALLLLLLRGAAALTEAPGLAWLLLCCEACLVIICYAVQHALPP